MKRILWLTNNRFSHLLEVPMIRELGYEVYEPKTMRFHIGCAEDDIFYESDNLLTISKSDLDRINSIDFWNINNTSEEKKIINSFFDCIYFDFDLNILKSVIRWFNGVILCRTFGLENGQSYSEIMANDNPVIFSEIDNISHRFRFLKPYKNMLESESEWFKLKLSYAPIPFLKFNDKNWNCIYNKVAVWAPEINSSAERKEKFEELSEELHTLDFVIYGKQSIQLMENKMAITEEKTSELLKYSAMVFESKNSEYLPLEVLYVAFLGVPVIHKNKSQLSNILGTNDNYKYKNSRELRSLVKRIEKNKKAKLNNIYREQLETYFSKDKCKACWKSMIDGLKPDLFVQGKPLKIAFVMPNNYLGGILDFTKRVAIAFVKGAEEAKRNVNVTIYHPENECYRKNDYFSDVKDMGIKVNQFHWVKRNQQWIKRYYSIKGYPVSNMLSRQEFYVMEDHLDNLGDFDYVFLTSDFANIFPYIIPVRYSVVVHDVIQRFDPKSMNLSYEQKKQFCTRCGEKVIVTTEPTRDFVINYEGIEKNDVVVIPQMFDNVKPTGCIKASEKKYFVWSTNKNPHKNHVKAFKGLIDYYEKGGSLDCYMTGADVHLIDPKHDIDETYKSMDYLVELRNIVDTNVVLKEHLIIKGNLFKDSYLNLLENAEFSFHPGHSDNGNGALVDAVQLGVPAVSSDYPAMRYMDKKMKLKIHFFDWNNPKKITEALFYMQEHASEIKEKLPESDYFYKYTMEGQADVVYEKLMSVILG